MHLIWAGGVGRSNNINESTCADTHLEKWPGFSCRAFVQEATSPSRGHATTIFLRRAIVPPLRVPVVPNEAESEALLAGVEMAAAGPASDPVPKKSQAAPTPAVPLEQLGSLLARPSGSQEFIDKRISKLIGNHFCDVNAELYQALKKAGLDDEVPANFGELPS
jgi:hypothetical protein